MLFVQVKALETAAAKSDDAITALGNSVMAMDIQVSKKAEADELTILEQKLEMLRSDAAMQAEFSILSAQVAKLGAETATCKALDAVTEEIKTLQTQALEQTGTLNAIALEMKELESTIAGVSGDSASAADVLTLTHRCDALDTTAGVTSASVNVIEERLAGMQHSNASMSDVDALAAQMQTLKSDFDATSKWTTLQLEAHTEQAAQRLREANEASELQTQFKLDALAATAANANAVTMLSSQVSILESQAKVASETSDAHTAAIEALQKASHDAANGLANAGELSTAVQALSDSVNTLSEGLHTVQKSVLAHELIVKDVGTMQTRLEQLNDNASSKEDVAALLTRINDLAASKADKTRVEAFQDIITALDASKASNEDVTSLRKRSETDISATDDRVTALGTAAATVAAELADVKGKLDSLAGAEEMMQLQKDVRMQLSSAAAVSAAVEALTLALADKAEAQAVKELQVRVSSLHDSSFEATDTLAATAAQLAQLQASVEVQNGELRSDVTMLKEKLTSVVGSNEVADLRKELASVQAVTAGLQGPAADAKSLESVQSEVAKLNSALLQATKDATLTAEKLAMITGATEQAATREEVSAVNAALAALTNNTAEENKAAQIAVKALDTSLAQLRADMPRAEDLKSVKADIAALADGMEAVAAFGELQANVTALTTGAKAIEGRLNSVEKVTETHSGEVAQLSGELEAIALEAKTAGARIKETAEDVEDGKSDVLRLSTALEALRQELLATAKEVRTEGARDAEAAATTVAELRSEIARVGDAAKTSAAASGDVGALVEKLDALEARLVQKTKELASVSTRLEERVNDIEGMVGENEAAFSNLQTYMDQELNSQVHL